MDKAIALKLYFDHTKAYERGSQVLQEIGWIADPREMFKPPSRAKGEPLQCAAITVAQTLKTTPDQLLDNALLAARIDHFSAIGGEAARDYFFGDHCRLDATKVARLSRRMPPFIKAKLLDLYAGCGNIDANATGAFDTNGWRELRVRLPKFAAMLQHYSQSDQHLEIPNREKLQRLLQDIRVESNRLLKQLKRFTPKGAGRVKESQGAPAPRVDWSQAATRFAQALGVLRKCNRDLVSPHWRKSWIPTLADLECLSRTVNGMKLASSTIELRLRGER